MKTAMCEKKNTLDETNSRLEGVKGKMNELEDSNGNEKETQ